MKESAFNNYFLRLISVVPIKLEALTMKQYIAIASVVLNTEHSHEARLLYALDICLGRGLNNFWLRLRSNFLDEDQMEELGALMANILNAEEGSEKNMIPYFKLRGKKYIGPYRNLTNINWGEFRNVSDYVTLYSRTRENKYIDQAMALVYLQKGKENDNNSFIDRSEVFAANKDALRLAFYLNWILMLNNVAPMFPHVFAKTPKKSKKPQLWYSFMGEWLEHKVEDFEKKDKQPMMAVLSSLEEMMKPKKK